MKLRALRVAECGRFREPVAVEGFSGGLDVLVGPNEAGKSTLLKALRLALTEKHTSNHSRLRDLVSYGASAPLVEVEFEAAGALWRLRKRFLNQRTAELRAMSGTQLARGADAEARLAELLGEGGQALIDMLWLEQGAMLASEPEPGEKGQDLLKSRLAAEIESAAGGDAVRRLHAAVRARLDEHVTRAREQRRGRFAALTTEAKAAADAHAAALRRQGEIEALTDRLATVAQSVTALTEPGAAETRRARLIAAQAALAAARSMLAERDGARAALAEARSAHETAAAAAKRFGETLGDRDRLRAEDAAGAGEAARLAAAVAEAARHRDDCRRLSAEAMAAAEALAADLRRARAHQQASERTDQLEKARATTARADALRARLAAERLPAGAVDNARRLEARIAAAAARLEAQSAEITVAYEPGQAGRIRAGGTALADGTRLTTDAPLVLEIAGLGRITVTPGHSADRAALAEALARDRAALSDVLAGAGVADLAGLVAREMAERTTRAALAEVEAELRALAPDGLARLEALAREAQAALTAAGGAGAAGALGPGAIEAEIERQRPLVARAVAAHEDATAAHARLARDEAVHVASSAERRRRLAEVVAALPPESELAGLAARLDADAATASRAYDEAARAHGVAASRAPDAAGLTRLEAEAAAAEDAQRKAEQQAAALAAEQARLAGQLEGTGDEDIADRVATLAAQAERAAVALADVAEEVDALRLLDGELTAATEAVQSRFVEPVLTRITPYLAELFPGSRIAIGAGFGAAHIARSGGAAEDVARLSDGTREQLAVIVRLGLARLLAEQGHAVPLILDDALVYADDERVAAMHRVLAAASAAHQVIVLTCREQAFSGLGGNRLAIRPWQVE